MGRINKEFVEKLEAGLAEKKKQSKKGPKKASKKESRK